MSRNDRRVSNAFCSFSHLIITAIICTASTVITAQKSVRTRFASSVSPDGSNLPLVSADYAQEYTQSYPSDAIEYINAYPPISEAGSLVKECGGLKPGTTFNSADAAESCSFRHLLITHTLCFIFGAMLMHYLPMLLGRHHPQPCGVHNRHQPSSSSAAAPPSSADVFLHGKSQSKHPSCEFKERASDDSCECKGLSAVAEPAEKRERADIRRRRASALCASKTLLSNASTSWDCSPDQCTSHSQPCAASAQHEAYQDPASHAATDALSGKVNAAVSCSEVLALVDESTKQGCANSKSTHVSTSHSSSSTHSSASLDDLHHDNSNTLNSIPELKNQQQNDMKELGATDGNASHATGNPHTRHPPQQQPVQHHTFEKQPQPGGLSKMHISTLSGCSSAEDHTQEMFDPVTLSAPHPNPEPTHAATLETSSTTYIIPPKPRITKTTHDAAASSSYSRVDAEKALVEDDIVMSHYDQIYTCPPFHHTHTSPGCFSNSVSDADNHASEVDTAYTADNWVPHAGPAAHDAGAIPSSVQMTSSCPSPSAPPIPTQSHHMPLTASMAFAAGTGISSAPFSPLHVSLSAFKAPDYHPPTKHPATPADSGSVSTSTASAWHTHFQSPSAQRPHPQQPPAFNPSPPSAQHLHLQQPPAFNASSPPAQSASPCSCQSSRPNSNPSAPPSASQCSLSSSRPATNPNVSQHVSTNPPIITNPQTSCTSPEQTPLVSTPTVHTPTSSASYGQPRPPQPADSAPHPQLIDGWLRTVPLSQPLPTQAIPTPSTPIPPPDPWHPSMQHQGGMIPSTPTSHPAAMLPSGVLTPHTGWHSPAQIWTGGDMFPSTPGSAWAPGSMMMAPHVAAGALAARNEAAMHWPSPCPSPFILRQTKHVDGTTQQELICSDAHTLAHTFGPAMHAVGVIAHVLQQMSGSVHSLNSNLSVVATRVAGLSSTMQGWLDMQSLQDQGSLADRCMATGIMVHLIALTITAIRSGRFHHVASHCLGYGATAAGSGAPSSSRHSPTSFISSAFSSWLPMHQERIVAMSWLGRVSCLASNLGLIGMALVLLACCAVPFTRYLCAQQVGRTWMVDVPLNLMLLCGLGGSVMVHAMGAGWTTWLLLWWSWCALLPIMSEVQLSFWPRLLLVGIISVGGPVACGMVPFASGAKVLHDIGCGLMVEQVPGLGWLHC